MIKLKNLIIAMALVALCPAVLSAARTISIAECAELLRDVSHRTPTESEYEFMIGQCEAFSDKFVRITREIKKLPDVESRKEAADSYNQSVAEEYKVYYAMLLKLKEALGNGMLGSTHSIEVKKLLADNDYINLMFTKYRSRYEL